MKMLEMYANSKEEDFKLLMEVAKDKLSKGELDTKSLDFLLREAYKTGHYAGHCRGELCVRESYGLDVAKEEE